MTPTDNGAGQDLDPAILAELLSDGLLWIMDREDDCTQLRQHSFPATWLEPGEPLTKRLLGGSQHVIVVQRPGADGAAFGVDVRRQLQALRWAGTLRRCPLPDPIFNLAILARETGDTERFTTYVASLAASGVVETLPTAKGRATHGTRRATATAGSNNGTVAADAEGSASLKTLLNTDFPKSDQLNADFLVQLHGHDLRYCHPWKRWLVWDGHCWQVDMTAEVMRRAKSTLHRLLGTTEFVDDKQELSGWLRHLQGSFSTGRLKGMVELAQSEPGIPVLPDTLDRDPWVLNCLNGVVDLQTGKSRPHQRKDLFTKQVPVAYDPDAKCPRWETFLREIFKKDQELITFIQRAVGYGLTGDTRERTLFICWGTGRNGK